MPVVARETREKCEKFYHLRDTQLIVEDLPKSTVRFGSRGVVMNGLRELFQYSNDDGGNSECESEFATNFLLHQKGHSRVVDPEFCKEILVKRYERGEDHEDNGARTRIYKGDNTTSQK